MKIVCAKNDLLTGINIVLKAVPAKTTMTILECILIKAENGSIRLVSNDMELGIETRVNGDIVEEGIIAISAKLFSEIVRKLPDSDVSIETDSSLNTKIVCDKVKFNISGKEGSEFPPLPAIEKKNSIRLSEFTLRELIRQTVFSISDSDTNKIMTGELFEIDGNKLMVVALDGHRIAIRKVELKENYSKQKVIVPGKALIEISKILSGELSDEVSIYISEKSIMFELANTIILSRLIEGEFYKINQMISADFETRITINNKDLYNSIDRATLFIRETDKKPIILGISDNTMDIKITTQIGSMDDQLAIEKEGKDILIGFNPKFITDILRVIDDETIDIHFLNPKAPCFIKDKEDTYMYLVLPININAAG